MSLGYPEPHEHDYVFDHNCDAQVCLECDEHRGLERCAWCNWVREPERAEEEEG